MRPANLRLSRNCAGRTGGPARFNGFHLKAFHDKGVVAEVDDQGVHLISCAIMDAAKEKHPSEPKDRYKVLLDTRNLEINLFWQRSNYFLGLNTGIAIGFFNLKTPTGRFTFAMVAAIVARAGTGWRWLSCQCVMPRVQETDRAVQPS
jgi:hypothetical protein